MPRYFFHLNECGDVLDDEEGRLLPGISAARRVAIEEARAIMAAEVLQGRVCLSCAINVRDAAGALIMTMPFHEALSVHDAC